MRYLLRFWTVCGVLALGWHAPPSAAAQTTCTLSGTVRDAATGEDLPGATVQVVEAKAGTTTNGYGFYSVTVPPGTYTLVVSYLGFATLRQTGVELRAATTRVFQLQPDDGQKLETVEVTARPDDPVKRADMSVERLDIRTANKVPVLLGERDILKTLQYLPGVTSAGEGAAGFSVRGGGTDQNLVLLDEAIIFNASHLFGFFSVFNSEAVKDFTLYKGGIPAAYGGRLSSVLDVRQRDGNTKRLRFSGGVGLISSRLTVEAPIHKDSSGTGRGAVLLAARRSYADIFLPLSGDANIRRNKLYFYDLNAKVNYRLGPRDRLFLSGYFGRDRLAIPRLFGASWGSTTATLRWNHLFSDRLFTNFTAITSDYDYRLDVLAVNPYTWRSNIITRNLKADASWFLAGTTLDFGASALAYDFRPGTVAPLDNSTVTGATLDRKYALETALYVSGERKLGTRLTLKGGLRHSGFLRTGRETIALYANDQPVRYDPGGGTYVDAPVTGTRTYGQRARIVGFRGWEPRFSASAAVSDNHAVKASYQRMYQYLHQVSNTTSPTPLDIYAPSGSYIAPAHADQVALGYFLTRPTAGYELSAEVYYKDLRNVVDYVDGANLALNNRLETELLSGRGRAYGLELLVKRTTGRLTGWVSYTLSRAETQVRGRNGGPGINDGAWYRTNFDRPHNLAATASYDWTARWSFAAAFTLLSGRPATYPTGRFAQAGLLVPAYGPRNAERLPAFHHLDVSATWTRPARGRWQGKWIFGLYNVYNRLNAASIFFQEKSTEINGADISTGQTEAVKLSYFGIVPSVSYEFEF